MVRPERSSYRTKYGGAVSTNSTLSAGRVFRIAVQLTLFCMMAVWSVGADMAAFFYPMRPGASTSGGKCLRPVRLHGPTCLGGPFCDVGEKRREGQENAGN